MVSATGISAGPDDGSTVACCIAGVSTFLIGTGSFDSGFGSFPFTGAFDEAWVVLTGETTLRTFRDAGLPTANVGFEGSPSFGTDRFTDCDLFGGVSDLSAVFDADAVVGRIMRARNPSSADAPGGRLCREGCFFRGLGGGGPSAGRWLPFFKVDGL